MANLRRMASLDCARHLTSTPASPTNTHLIRHSSLPNIFLCQPELAVANALIRCSSLKKGSLSITEGRSVSTPSKLALVCRALSGSHYVDDTPEFERPATASQGWFALPNGNVRTQTGPPFASSKKEAIVATNLDLEKSVVYSELRESACRWEVPPRFFMPYDAIGEKVSAQRDAHLHRLHNNSQTKSDLCMQNNCGVTGVKDRPMSLRMLKRKLSKVSPPTEQWKPKEALEKRCGSHELASSQRDASVRPRLNYVVDIGDSVFSAFASLVYMLKMLQQHALSNGMQSHASCADFANERFNQNWVGRAYAEMLDSLVWLFQQVFSCTPKLMLLTMMLLADFTLHSVSKHVTIPVMHHGEPPTATTLLYNTAESTVMGGFDAMSHRAEEEQQLVAKKEHGTKGGILEENLPSELGGGGGYSSGVVIKHGESNSDGSGDSSPPSKMSLECTVKGDDADTRISTTSSSLRSSLLSRRDIVDIKGFDLDTRTKNMLVAPIRAPTLEADDYPCFDRTDLTYQQEISADPNNPLLLANYAQFLHVVRHDNGRAEKLYRRAVMVDAGSDGEVMGRFASFLWVVKGDVVEAESAYKAVLAADPTNAYHAGCYAHFLWSSGACQAEETSCCSTVDG
ncbi:hypothetical protein L7F22_015930 [Adiantum nelumboides]|nr:hypothetical protein [Adiantum nelumboides]